MNLEKFSPYQWFCALTIACLKPFTVVIETLLHRDVGERYAGLSALVALLLLGADAEFCPPTQSTLVWLLMAAFALRVVTVRVAGIRRRRRGDYSVHNRSPGHSLLNSMSSRLPPAVMSWIEPIAVILAAFVVAMFNPTVGDFLLWSGASLLGINLIRLSAAYNKQLDDVDGRVEQEARSIEGGFVTPLGISAGAALPASQTSVRDIHPGLLPIAVSGDAEVEADPRALLPVGGGAAWKQ